jgi:hypothetical protein
MPLVVWTVIDALGHESPAHIVRESHTKKPRCRSQFVGWLTECGDLVDSTGKQQLARLDEKPVTCRHCAAALKETPDAFRA